MTTGAHKPLRARPRWDAATVLTWSAFAVYLALAVVHAQERILNSDCGYQLFWSIQDRGFFFQEARYGMFITQVPMLAALWALAPMNVLVLAYSTGLALTYGACILLARHVFRSAAAALAIMLSLVVGIGDSFYHATTETHLLVALSGLLYGAVEWLHRTGRAPRRYAVVALIVVWAMFTHPNALFMVGFVMVLSLLLGRLRLPEVLGFLALCGLYFAGRLLSLPEDSYDGRLYEELLNAPAIIARPGELFPIWFIGQYLRNEYIAVVVLIVVVVLFHRDRYAMLFTMGAALALWGISIIVFHEGSGEAMMEKTFLPGIAMLCVPFAVLCTTHRWRRGFTVLAALLFVHAFTNIHLRSRSYSERLDALATIMDRHAPDAPKLLLAFSEIEGTALHFSEWATSIDALMLSRCRGDRPRTVFLWDDTNEARSALDDPGAFLYLPWQPHLHVPLDPHYFPLPHRPYTRVSVALEPRVGRFSGS
ncbi:MAG: hypothetical protein RBT71_08355 [Flavobacteriales bacterium]|jgi:hypothetical protein|nr:hypothetical protein [Flavobacteriales bacterium]